MKDAIECKYCGALTKQYPCHECGYEPPKPEQDTKNLQNPK